MDKGKLKVVDNNISYCEETKKLKGQIEVGFVSLGERLKLIRDENLFVGRWESFDDYVSDMKMSQGTASKLINIYEKFILSYGITAEKLIEAGGWSVVAETLPLIDSKEKAEEWINKAINLSTNDLRKELKEAKTGVKMYDCQHEDSYLVKICRTCGERMRVYDQD